MKNFLLASIMFFLCQNIHAQNELQFSRSYMDKGDFKMGVHYAKKAWRQKSSVYAGYLLSFGLYNTGIKDSAAFYANKSLYGSGIFKDVTLTENQIKQLMKIIDLYEKSKTPSKMMFNKYHTSHTISARLVMSGNPMYADETSQAWENSEPEQWQLYLDSLSSMNVSDSLIRIMNAERNEIQYHIDDPIVLDCNEEKIYEYYDYPELYGEKDFLIYPMLLIYDDFISFQCIENENYYVQKYGLTLGNIYCFYWAIFPEISMETNQLPELIKKYK